MKISLALLVLLLAAAWAGSQGASLRSSQVVCCPKEKFVQGKIPGARILEYRYTPSNCTHKAVLVKLRVGTVCVEEKRFQKYLREQKKKNSTSK